MQHLIFCVFFVVVFVDLKGDGCCVFFLAGVGWGG